ncbi:MAG: HAD family hydrolase [Succinivibrionaceae bacterium]
MDLSFIRKYQGLIFDLDGTLVNSMPFHVEAWYDTLKKYGIEIDRAWLYAHGGVPSYKIARELISKFKLKISDEHTLAHQKTEAYLNNISNVDIYPQMLELLKYAKGLNIPMAIGTGTLRSNVEYIVNHTLLKDFIKVIVSADDVTKHKPHPETFLKAAQLLNIAPEKSAVFEDAPLGIEAGRRGNFQVVLVENGYIKEIHFK